MNRKCGWQEESNRQAFFPLVLAGAGEKVRVVLIRDGAHLQKRLLSMGIQINDTIEVIQSGGEKRAILVAKDANRFMLGGGMAQKIYVIKE